MYAFIPLDGKMYLLKLLSLSQSNVIILAGTRDQSMLMRSLGLWKQISALPSVLPFLLSTQHKANNAKKKNAVLSGARITGKGAVPFYGVISTEYGSRRLWAVRSGLGGFI